MGRNLATTSAVLGYDALGLGRVDTRRYEESDHTLDYEILSFDDNNIEPILSGIPNLMAVIHTATCYGRNSESVAEILDTNTAFPIKPLDIVARRGVRYFVNTDTVLQKYLCLSRLLCK